MSFWETRVSVEEGCHSSIYAFLLVSPFFSPLDHLRRSQSRKLRNRNPGQVSRQRLSFNRHQLHVPSPILPRLPGRTAMEPRVFKFGTPYEYMYNQLALTPEDVEYFTRNGVLQLCRRGAAVKKAPQRWQDTPTDEVAKHDIVIAFEERIYDSVVEDLQMREPTEDFQPIVVICLDTKDNPLEAARQGMVALELCWRLEKCDDLASEAIEVIEQFQEERASETSIKILYQLCYL